MKNSPGARRTKKNWSQGGKLADIRDELTMLREKVEEGKVRKDESEHPPPRR